MPNESHAKLQALVAGLEAQSWSSWQSTDKFDMPLREALEHLRLERIRDAAPRLHDALRRIVNAQEVDGDWPQLISDADDLLQELKL